MSAAVQGEVWTVGRLLEWTTDYFKRNHVDSPRLDAEVLLADALSCRRIDLYLMYESEVGDRDRARFRDYVRRRAGGCPTAYLVGYREFYSLRFDVNPSVLIPRPETEFLVAEVLSFAKNEPVARFLDIGVGSGAIAITLAHQMPTAVGVAADRSLEALAVARKNAERHGVAERIAFLESDLFSALLSEDRFDVIASNPPYVSTAELRDLVPEVRDHEPALALDGGDDGMSLLAPLVRDAPAFLRGGGLLVLEIAPQRHAQVRSTIEAQGSLTLQPTIKDGAGMPRVVRAIKR